MSLYERFSRRPEWELAIGRLMMASASIEISVLQTIANYGGVPMAKKAFARPHSARLKTLESLASGRDTKTQEAVGGIVEQLRQFNKERNHAAHSPLMYALDDGSTDDHKYGAIVHIGDPDRRIGLDEIKALADRAKDLSSHFTFTWMMIMGVPK